jgi:hypothetical protein
MTKLLRFKIELLFLLIDLKTGRYPGMYKVLPCTPRLFKSERGPALQV